MDVAKGRSKLEAIIGVFPATKATQRVAIPVENGFTVKIFERLALGAEAAQHVVRYGLGGTGDGRLGSVRIEENERVIVLGVGKEEVVDEATELAHVGTNRFVFQDAGAKDGNLAVGGDQVHPRELSTATLVEKVPVGILPDLLGVRVLLLKGRHGGFNCDCGGIWGEGIEGRRRVIFRVL
jgi:hypothetical protein